MTAIELIEERLSEGVVRGSFYILEGNTSQYKVSPMGFKWFAWMTAQVEAEKYLLLPHSLV